MSGQKKETIYEEARRVVEELNNKLDDMGDSVLECGFVYTEGSYACGISIGEIDLWDSVNDDRIYDEDKDELEPLLPCIAGKVATIAETLTKIAKGIK